MIEDNNPLGWEHLYDMYAPMMYGAILKLTNNEKAAENILIESFALLKENTYLLKTNNHLYMHLLHHTYNTAKNILGSSATIQEKDNTITEMFPVINCLLQTSSSVRNVTTITGVTKGELKLKLHEELKQLRNKKKYEFKLYAVV